MHTRDLLVILGQGYCIRQVDNSCMEGEEERQRGLEKSLERRCDWESGDKSDENQGLCANLEHKKSIRVRGYYKDIEREIVVNSHIESVQFRVYCRVTVKLEQL